MDAMVALGGAECRNLAVSLRMTWLVPKSGTEWIPTGFVGIFDTRWHAAQWLLDKSGRNCVLFVRSVMLHMQEDLKETRSTESRSAEKASRPWYKPLWRFPRSWTDVKRLGWKFILGFILFYLIRDTILYIIIPYLIYKGIISW
jgi:hypothetical protein